MNFSDELRQSIKESTLNYIKENKISKPKYQERGSAIIFKSDISSNPNFYTDTLHNILNKKGVDWSTRLDKKHSHYDDETKEMDSSNSSDALLMNIFCHPSFFKWKGPSELLNINSNIPEFGWNPEIETHSRPTEVDMKIGSVIFEAKLTERYFSEKKLKTVNANYPELGHIIDLDPLLKGSKVKHYQLLRNIYAVNKNDCISRFNLIVDYRRPDLIQSLMEVVRLIKDPNLRNNCGFITWQEIARTVGKDLQSFLKLKYGI